MSGNGHAISAAQVNRDGGGAGSSCGIRRVVVDHAGARVNDQHVLGAIGEVERAAVGAEVFLFVAETEYFYAGGGDAGQGFIAIGRFCAEDREIGTLDGASRRRAASSSDPDPDSGCVCRPGRNSHTRLGGREWAVGSARFAGVPSGGGSPGRPPTSSDRAHLRAAPAPWRHRSAQ